MRFTSARNAEIISSQRCKLEKEFKTCANPSSFWNCQSCLAAYIDIVVTTLLSHRVCNTRAQRCSWSGSCGAEGRSCINLRKVVTDKKTHAQNNLWYVESSNRRVFSILSGNCEWPRRAGRSGRVSPYPAQNVFAKHCFFFKIFHFWKKDFCKTFVFVSAPTSSQNNHPLTKTCVFCGNFSILYKLFSHFFHLSEGFILCLVHEMFCSVQVLFSRELIRLSLCPVNFTTAKLALPRAVPLTGYMGVAMTPWGMGTLGDMTGDRTTPIWLGGREPGVDGLATFRRRSSGKK